MVVIAVEGCCHGALDNVYATLEQAERLSGVHVDLLVCCGDFQAVRNTTDLAHMACPPKYRHIETFYQYYTGEKVAPVLTVFIGGNHEASNHLWELYYGGWVAPNIFYMGHAGVLWCSGLRIGGLSGIFKARDYKMGHFERFPYSTSDLRSTYHIREFDVYRLLQLSGPIDVFLSHDWPRGIARHGDTHDLLRRKPFLRSDVMSNMLGSPPAERLLFALQPMYWFSAHLHVKFPALVVHAQPNPEEIPLDLEECEEEHVVGQSPLAPTNPRCTKFLALDKCLPGRRFLQILDLPHAQGPIQLSYDEEWLAIVRATHSQLCCERRRVNFPTVISDTQREAVRVERQWVHEHVTSRPAGLLVPNNFVPHVPGFPQEMTQHPPPPNPQRADFLHMLDLMDNFPDAPSVPFVPNPEEINLDIEECVQEEEEEEEEEGEEGEEGTRPTTNEAPRVENPEEISLEDI